MRNYDVILFGATGFTGQLTAHYLARQDQPLRWAIAGRDSTRLKAVRETLQENGKYLPDILLADSAMPDSLAALARQARVIISTVGPYLKYGEPLVKACVDEGADYVDLTGEPEFVNRMRASYGRRAQEQGVRIVHCCGFDSIPHDLGVYYTLRLLQERLGSDALAAATVDVIGTVRAHGDFSGGTWQSAINAMARAGAHVREQRAQKHGRGVKNGRKISGGKPRLHRQDDAWTAPLPTIDPQVVLSSARGLPFYGKEFRYSHQVAVGSLPRLLLGTAGVAGIFVGAQFGPTRRLLEKYKTSGEGPAPEVRAGHWFKVRFEAEVSVPGGQPCRLQTEVAGGDPGYDETAKMLAESALSLAFGGERLPEAAGVLTPALAMGDVLLARLQAAGLRFRELPLS